MKLRLTEKQVNRLIIQLNENQEVREQETAGTDPEAAKPTAGTSSQQSGGKGYPEVGKWESGVTRGPANQIAVTKWSDIVGSVIKRSKGNQLKEQWYNDPKHPEWRKYAPTDYEKRESQKSTNLLNNLDPHTILQVSALVSAFIPVVGPIIAAGLGVTDAYLYHKEGDDKMAGMMLMFSLIPGLSIANKIPGVKQLGSKAMSELGKKIALGSTKFSQTELQIINEIGKNRQLIQNELIKLGKDASIKVAKQKVKNQAIKQTIKSTGKTMAGYTAAGVAYDKTYDYLERKKEEENLKKLNQMLGIKN